MGARKDLGSTRHGERGVTAVMVVVAPVVYLATSALAIALTALNVARNEAQQALEAAALAGAKVFGETGFISGKASQAAPVQTLARQRAIAVGARKKVGRQTVASRIAT